MLPWLLGGFTPVTTSKYIQYAQVNWHLSRIQGQLPACSTSRSDVWCRCDAWTLPRPWLPWTRCPYHSSHVATRNIKHIRDDITLSYREKAQSIIPALEAKCFLPAFRKCQNGIKNPNWGPSRHWFAWNCFESNWSDWWCKSWNSKTHQSSNWACSTFPAEWCRQNREIFEPFTRRTWDFIPWCKSVFGSFKWRWAAYLGRNRTNMWQEHQVRWAEGISL